MIKKVKNIVPWLYVVNDLNGEKIVGTFYRQIPKRKGDNMLNGKDTINGLTAG